MANTVTIQSDSPITVSQGGQAPAGFTVLSPDGHSIYSQDQANADTAAIAACSASIKADPNCVQGITPVAWVAALEAEDARWREASKTNPADQPNYPPGPFGVRFIPGAVHDNGPSSPFSGGTWEMDNPSAWVQNWYGAPPSIKNCMAAWLKPHISGLKLQTKPGWSPLGWGPVSG